MATWKNNNLTITRLLLPDAEIGEESILRNKTLRVLISKVSFILFYFTNFIICSCKMKLLKFYIIKHNFLHFFQAPPYGFVKESANELEGNDRYEGFTIDLIEKLSEILGFNYEFDIEEDYGNINPENGKWTGMVLQLREEVMNNI